MECFTRYYFINFKKKTLENNIRMKFMINLLDKMNPDKKRDHFENAKLFLNSLD